MKRNCFFLLCIALFSLIGCSKDNDETSDNEVLSGAVSNSDIKKWIRDKMDNYYLWNNKMPEEGSINGTLSIEDYFETLLYRSNKNVERKSDTYGDRFSHIDNLITATRSEQIAENDFGGRLTVISYSKTEMMAQFMYVSPDSPLGIEGKIKRGTIFNKVDGIQLSPSNYNTLLSKSAMTISNDSKFGAPLVATQISQRSYPGTPILFHDILSIDGQLVGYLVYNEFKRGPDENDFNNTEFEEELKAVFQKFKAQRIDKLVLDMRYNPGGYLVTAQLIASLIAPEDALGKVLAYHKFNSKVENSPSLKKELGGNTDFFLTKDKTPNNLNLNNVCIITTENTASASEFVLNCLKPYMSVIHVGETTIGKNQSAISFKRTPKNDWEISPIISYVENSRHEGGYEAGITPKYESHDYKMIIKDGEWYISDVNLYKFGDYINEPMLHEALIRLGLNVQSPTAARRNPSSNILIAKNKIVKFQQKDKGLIKVVQ